MTERQKIWEFDEKVAEFEGRRRYGMRGMNPLWFLMQFGAGILMLMPLKFLIGAGCFWVIIQGLLIGIGGSLRMDVLMGMEKDGSRTAWKEYLKYVPVDWKEYRRHRYEILGKYVWRTFLCFVVLQVISQVLSGTFVKYGYQWEAAVYAAVMCFLFLLVPGVLRIRRWC